MRGGFQMPLLMHNEDYQSTSVSAWCGPLYPHKVSVHPMSKNLYEQVLYRPQACTSGPGPKTRVNRHSLCRMCPRSYLSRTRIRLGIMPLPYSTTHL